MTEQACGISSARRPSSAGCSAGGVAAYDLRPAEKVDLGRVEQIRKAV